MTAPRIYLDTSVLGGYYDDEFSGPTRQLFHAFSQGKLTSLVSSTLLEEVELAPHEVRKLLATLLDLGAERLEAVATCFELQEAYLAAGVISRRYADDALHVAHATLSKADAIVSWNFKHLVRADRIRGYNRVNQSYGHDAVVILTPLDIIQGLEAGTNEDA